MRFLLRFPNRDAVVLFENGLLFRSRDYYHLVFEFDCRSFLPLDGFGNRILWKEWKVMSGILPRLDKMDDRVHPIRFRDHDRKSGKKEFFVIEEAVFVKKELTQPKEGRLSAITDDDIERKVATSRRRSATV